MKKILPALAALLLVLSLTPQAAAAETAVTVLVNGQAVSWTDAKPFINGDGRTMVPLRPVAEAMGLEADWDAKTHVASFTMRGVAESGRCPWTNTIAFPIGKSAATGTASANWIDSEPDVETETIPMDTAAVIVGGRTYAPVRYLAAYFGFTVDWNAASKTASITGGAYVSPADYDGVNLLLGTWMADTSLWSEQSRAEIGAIQCDPYLVFQVDGHMGYQCWDALYEGTYLLNTAGDDVYAVATLQNGWRLTLRLTNGSLEVDGLPPVQIQYPAGTQTTGAWGFYYYGGGTSYGLDPWLE